MKKQYILITGIAGFIGFSLARKLLKLNFNVIGIDSFNDYYDTKIKYDRINILKKLNNKPFIIKNDLQNFKIIKKKLISFNIVKIFHLAAQAGVRHSIKKPEDYVTNNLIAFSNVLEIARFTRVKHLIFASSSSVYGENNKAPFSEYKSDANHPIQFYGATKRANEIMAYSYSHLYKIPISITRLFTVYGPWGRPDMALYLFVKNILLNLKIQLFNDGNHYRSFTYIDDVVNALILVSKKPSIKKVPYEIFNVSSGDYVPLKKYVKLIENELGKKAKITFKKIQQGDVVNSLASINKLKKLGFKPKTHIKKGIKEFVNWYKSYNKKNLN